MNLAPGRTSFGLLALVCAVAACRTPLEDRISPRTQTLFGRDAVGDAESDRFRMSEVTFEPTVSTLGGYIRSALLDNADLRVAYQRYRAATERSQQAGYWPEPVVGYAGFIEAIQTRTGPQQHRFSVTQRVPWPGRLSEQQRRALAMAEAAWQDVQARLRAVRLAVERAYYEFCYDARQRSVATETLDLLRALQAVVRRRIETGAPQADLLRLEVRIGELEDRLASLDEMRTVHSAKLHALMNQKAKGMLPWPEFDEPEIGGPRDRAQLRERLLAQNPDLAALNERIAAAEAVVQEAEFEGWPDVSVGADLFATATARNPATPGSGEDPFALRLQFAVPIWQDKYAARRREARALYEAAVSELVARREGLDRELAMALFRASDGERRVLLYRDQLLPRARQTLQLTQAAYSGARATFLEVIDSQQTLLAFEQSYWRACADYEISRAEITALCGGEL